MGRGGDELARGNTSAQFQASDGSVSQDKWNEAVGGDVVDSFLERLRKRAIAEGVSEEEFERQKQDLQAKADELDRQEKERKAEIQRKIRVRPVQDRIIVQRVEVADEFKSVVQGPDEAKEKPYEGRVIAVGPGKHLPNGEFVPVTIQVGEIVVFGKFSGAEVYIGFEQALVLREEDIFYVKEVSSLPSQEEKN